MSRNPDSPQPAPGKGAMRPARIDTTPATKRLLADPLPGPSAQPSPPAARSKAAAKRALVDQHADQLLRDGLPLAVAISLAPMAAAKAIYEDAATQEAKEAGTGAILLADHLGLLNLADKAAARILATAGMAASPSAAPVYANLFVDARGNAAAISPIVLAALGGAKGLAAILGQEPSDSGDLDADPGCIEVNPVSCPALAQPEPGPEPGRDQGEG